MQVCGRESERTLLEQWLGRPTAWPAAVAPEGVAGIGKSTLWREAVGLAREHGLHVIATAPSEPDRALAFAALGDLFSELRADVVAALPTPQQQALSAALFEEDGVPGSGPQALPRAVLGVLRGLAGGDPLLVAIGDEQWLDRPSARVLAFALCRLRAERAGVLLSRRPVGDSALWPELSRAFGGAVRSPSSWSRSTPPRSRGSSWHATWHGPPLRGADPREKRNVTRQHLAFLGGRLKGNAGTGGAMPAPAVSYVWCFVAGALSVSVKRIAVVVCPLVCTSVTVSFVPSPSA